MASNPSAQEKTVGVMYIYNHETLWTKQAHHNKTRFFSCLLYIMFNERDLNLLPIYLLFLSLIIFDVFIIFSMLFCLHFLNNLETATKFKTLQQRKDSDVPQDLHLCELW